MNVVFLAGLFPQEIRKIIENDSKGVIQYAADALQWGFVKGLSHFFTVRIINLPFVGAYPKFYKRIYVPSCKFHHVAGADDVSVGFLNIPIIKHYFRYLNVKKELKKWCLTVNNRRIIVIYSMHSPFLKAAVEVKRIYPNLEICLIVPDLPQFMSTEQSYTHKILKLIDSIFIRHAMKEVDSFVLLSTHMAVSLNINDKPYVHIEGIYNPADEKTAFTDKEKNKTILYTGTLDKRYGILNLLHAFISIKNENYRLWICGDGNCRNEVTKYAELDKRIKYFGQQSRESVLLLQKKATVLVNPRTSEDNFTKYSFPSKTIEYMASGTPCIMHRLEGIPHDYYKYCFVAEQESAEGLHNTIIKVCEMDQSELNEFGEKALLYIQAQKNPISQVRKMFEMFSNQERNI